MGFKKGIAISFNDQIDSFGIQIRKDEISSPSDERLLFISCTIQPTIYPPDGPVLNFINLSTATQAAREKEISIQNSDARGQPQF